MRTDTYTFEVGDLDITGTTHLADDGSMKIELAVHDGAGKITVEYTDSQRVTEAVEQMTHELRDILDELISTAFQAYTNHFLQQLFR